MAQKSIEHADSQREEKVYSSVRATLEVARGKVERAVNSAMVEAYWEIGRQIVEATGERAEYGKHLVEYLAERLTAEYGKGFTKRNLYQMQQFYLAFPIVHTLSAQLSWSHYRRLMRIPDREQREFYMNAAAEERWTVRQTAAHDLSLQPNNANRDVVTPKQVDEVLRGEKDGRGVVAGVHGNAPAIDELLVEDDLDPVRGVVEGAEGRDRPGGEPEKPGEVRLGGKGEPAGADALLDLAERDALLVWEADEVVGSVSVVAQEEVLGAVCGKRDLCLPGLLDGEDRRVLGELEGYALALEHIKRGALVEHVQPSLALFPFRLIVSLPSDV